MNLRYRPMSAIKRLLVPRGKAPRTILGGLLRGLKMNLDLTYQTQFFLGLYEREIHRDLRELSRGVKTVVDIGAAEGLYTLYFLTRTPSDKVFAFEPDATSRMHLENNIDLNTDRSRLEISSKFVGAYENKDQCTLDSLLPFVSTPCLIKMDVEGAEVDILHGAKKFLDLPHLHWLVETHSKQLEEECIKIFDKAGFMTQVIPNAWWRVFIPELRICPHNRWLIAKRDKK